MRTKNAASRVDSKWIRNESDERAVAEGYKFSTKDAEDVAFFFHNFLRHSKGEWAGRPFDLLEWEYEDVIAPLFGWKRPDGMRRFTRAYVEIPKKNGKSTIAAGIGLYMLCGDLEAGAEVYSTASSRDQANIVHGEAVRMVKASAPLSLELDINHSSHVITHLRSQSRYQCLAAEPGAYEGKNAHCVIIDELHVWLGDRGRKAWNALLYAGRSRRQPILFAITTAGSDPTSICWEQHEYAEKIAKSEVVDLRLLPYIRAAEESDDLSSPETWRKANPSMGQGGTISEERFREDYEEAAAGTLSGFNSFKRYSLNLWIRGANPWISSDDWAKCPGDVELQSLAGRRCFGGLDLSHTRDFSAFALIFPDEDEGFTLAVRYWLPEGALEKNSTPAVFKQWAYEGHIGVTPGPAIEYAAIRAGVHEWADRFEIVDFGYDPWNADETTAKIEEAEGIRRFKFNQTYTSFNEPSQIFERTILDGKLRHTGNPVFSWQLGHCQLKIEPLNGNQRPVRPGGRDDPRTIDGVIAAVMALGRAIDPENKPQESAYQDRGMIWLDV